MITDFTNPERKKWSEITKRPELDFKKIKPLVKKIFKDVTKNGDKSLYKYTKEFDKIDIKSIKTKRKDFLNSENKVSEKLKLAIKSAKKNIEDAITKLDSMDINLEELYTEIEKVGLSAFLDKYRETKLK